MTVFNIKQHLDRFHFKYDFFMKIPWIDADCCLNRHASVFVCVFVKASNKRDDWRQFSSRQTAAGHSEQRELPTVCFLRLWKHILRRHYKNLALVWCLCSRNLGCFKCVSHHGKADSLSLLYTPFLFFIRLCKHKKVLKLFCVCVYCVARFPSLVNQSEVTEHSGETAET